MRRSLRLRAVRVRRRVAGGGAARRRLEPHLALVDVREEAVVVQLARLHEARRDLRDPVVGRVLDLAAARLAVEALDDAEWHGAVVRVGCEVRVRTLVRRPNGPVLDALAVRYAELGER